MTAGRGAIDMRRSPRRGIALFEIRFRHAHFGFDMFSLGDVGATTASHADAAARARRGLILIEMRRQFADFCRYARDMREMISMRPLSDVGESGRATLLPPSRLGVLR